MAYYWCRLYAEFAYDPKMQMLPECMQRRFIMLLCFRCGNDGKVLQDSEVMFLLRISMDETRETKALFVTSGFINKDWTLKNWQKRQRDQKAGAARVAKSRAKKKVTTIADDEPLRSADVTTSEPLRSADVAPQSREEKS